MNDNASLSKRRLQTGLVLGVLLLGGVIAGWWYWNRGDSRFIGKWEDVNEASPPEYRDTLEFLPSGVAYYGIGGRDRTMWTTWRVAGDILQLGDPPDAPMGEAKLHAAQWLNANTGASWLPYGNTFVIESIGPNEIRARVGDGEDAGRFVFRRISR